MTAETNTQTTTDPAMTVIAFWQQWMEQSSRGTKALLDALDSASDPSAVQKRWMDAVSENLEGFLRTPAFLEMMKRNLKAMTDLKMMQDQIIEGTAGQLGLPLAKDITGLFERLSSMNHAILDRLSAIEARLDSLDGKAKKTGESGG
jgi:hypothetical protein